MSYIPEHLKRSNIRAEVIKRDKRTCQYCGKKNLRGRSLHVDHITSDTEGGAYTVVNLMVTCAQCNFRKGKRNVADYIVSRLKALELEKQRLTLLLEEHRTS